MNTPRSNPESSFGMVGEIETFLKTHFPLTLSIFCYSFLTVLKKQKHLEGREVRKNNIINPASCHPLRSQTANDSRETHPSLSSQQRWLLALLCPLTCRRDTTAKSHCCSVYFHHTKRHLTHIQDSSMCYFSLFDVLDVRFCEDTQTQFILLISD